MEQEWTGRTDGGTILQRWLIGILRWVDVRVIYFFMAFVVPFYMIFNRKGYKAMRDYMKRSRGISRGKCGKQERSRGLRMVWDIYRNHFVFGQVIVDRFAVYAGRKFNMIDDEKVAVDTQMQKPEGMVIFSSHVGNYELAGATFVSSYKKFYALVFGGETKAVMQNRQKVLPDHRINMIPVNGDLSHIFMMNAAIDNGDVVSMPADRRLGSAKSIECQFMGANAAFPAGPFLFVVQKDVPVFAVFVMKEKGLNYRLRVRKLESAGGNVRQRSALLAQSFANELEQTVREYPYQWFNYYDFWKKDD